MHHEAQGVHARLHVQRERERQDHHHQTESNQNLAQLSILVAKVKNSMPLIDEQRAVLQRCHHRFLWYLLFIDLYSRAASSSIFFI